MEKKGEHDQQLPQIFIDTVQKKDRDRSWLWNIIKKKLDEFMPGLLEQEEQDVAAMLFEKAAQDIKQGDQILLQVEKSFVIKKVRGISFFISRDIHKGVCNLEGDPMETTYDLGGYRQSLTYSSYFLEDKHVIPILESADRTVALLQHLYQTPVLLFKEQNEKDVV